MNDLLFVLFIYIFLLFIWGIINLIFYALTIIFRRNFSHIPYSINWLLNSLLGIFLALYPIYILWQIVKSGEWVLFFIFILIGSFIIGLWQSIMGLLIAPFGLLTAYFSIKSNNVTIETSQEYDYEYISPEGKVLEKGSSEDKVNKKLAIYFLLSFLINILYIITHSEQYQMFGFLDYIFTSGFFMLQNILIFGIILGIYSLVRHRRFIYPSGKVFLTNLFKIDIFTVIGIQILAIIYLWLIWYSLIS